MDERTFRTLELDGLVALLARHVQTPLGRKRALALLPTNNAGVINQALNLTTEAADYLATGGAFGLGDVADPSSSLAELHVQGTSLDPHQILALQALIGSGMDLRGR